MNIFEMTEKFAKKMKWYDFSMLKGTMLFFTLFLVTVFEGFREFVMQFNPYWYLAISLALMIPLLKKMFCNKAK